MNSLSLKEENVVQSRAKRHDLIIIFNKVFWRKVLVLRFRNPVQAKALIVLTIFLLSTLVFFYPASAAAPSLILSYYARPFFTPQQGSASLIYLGFPYPEGSPPYTPPWIAEYYGSNSMPGRGRGETIVTVDAFGSPTILQDVVVFDSYFHFPPIGLQVIKLIGPSSLHRRIGRDGPWRLALTSSGPMPWHPKPK